MIGPRDLYEAYRRTGTDAEAAESGWRALPDGERRRWRRACDELAAVEAHRSPSGTAYLVVSTTGGDDEVDWIDEQVWPSLAAGSRRADAMRNDIRPHEADPERRYLVRPLRVGRFDPDRDGGDGA